MSVSQSSFSQFLDRLGDVLDARAADRLEPAVLFDPARRTPSAPDEVYVGLGVWQQGGAPVAHQGICLNNKGAAAMFGWKREPLTVAAFVRDAPDNLVATWRALFSDSPEAALKTARFIVEDASPDSVLSVIFWLARLHGISPSELPPRWITALTAWERDGISPSVTRSWTALMSALAHSYFGPGFSGHGIGAAWRDAMRFTVSLLQAGADPDAVDGDHCPAILADAAYGRAIAFAMNEKQDYLQSLSRAVTLELLVPMAGSPGRELLVDAYFAVETGSPSGVKKIYIRTDADNTSLGNGFSLMGLYRPGLEGSGNDMTISVDPRSGIALHDLWTRLEALENERWEGVRPDASPRRIASYPDGQGFDQPWWDDHGRYTLLGAPKRVSADDLGTKLTWADVLECVWRSYNQLRAIRIFDMGIQSGRLELTPIEESRPRRIASGEGDAAVVKQLLAVKWNRRTGEAQALQFTTTVRRHLAALINRAAAGRSGPVPLSELTDPSDFDFLEVPGGSAIVSRDGALLFDDWRDKDLALPALTNDFTQAVVLLSACRTFDAEVDDLYAKSLAQEGLFRSNTADILRRITVLRGRIASVFQKVDLSDASPERRMLRSAVEQRWGLDGREAALTGRLKDLQEILEAKATLDTQGMAQLIGIVAIPNFVVALMALYVATVDQAAGGTMLGYVGLMTALVVFVSMIFLLIAIFATRGKR
jgi:hypothetical protein